MISRIIIVTISLLYSNSLFAQDDRRDITGYKEYTKSSGEIIGNDAIPFEAVLATDEQYKWSVYIPKGYDSSKPPGILVHITERNQANMPFGWESAMDDKNLIWISMNKVGRLPQNKEMLLTVLAAPLIESQYSINPDRVYIAASTDGCHPASAAMQVYPTIFKGAIYATCLPINWRNDTPDTIELMRNNRYVFIASKEQDIRQQMRRSYRKYTNSDFENVEFINVPDLIYGKSIKRRRLLDAIEILDSRD
ncbi:hypothetical protein [Pseudemcibacter aquimaris]|uniref:hypothetical protein n=1 Tax=Pseudemcibacter aquimaris TaxID=2857064 RepID=UPI0020138940|nr:hypothetical protein [Pseudemcibacter aquimaris]MCC3860226.1 hypothetical protein [Pseudemcibacter aquimaris]WDU57551.1 hypothetical protein KW060_10125 [Pseudemcibacter aquimaris]